VTFSLFGLFSAYFVGATLFVVISMFVLNNKIKNIDSESAAISSAMLSNNEKLSRFALSKLILTEYERLTKTKFRYKDYLDQISLLLPANASLVGIDFKNKGWISLVIKTDDVFSLQTLEGVIMRDDTWANSTFFKGAYIEGVNRDKSGSYNTSLQLELKGNG
jgi:hypothetical protein